jgi:hypothetical protein
MKRTKAKAKKRKSSPTGWGSGAHDVFEENEQRNAYLESLTPEELTALYAAGDREVARRATRNQRTRNPA